MIREGATHRDTALKILGSADMQPMVNGWKKQVQGESKQHLGGIYENAVTLRLSQQGYGMQHLGGNGEPDILTTKDEKITTVSCKIYDEPKKVVSNEPLQFRPEIYFEKKNNLEKFVLFFYNLSWQKEIIHELIAIPGLLR
ncbi:MAG: hypothetical protein LUP94_00365 [Candidatus Methanomethylicus sp.]|nr:hypothetical protein [Candidatus Methanomethylicus sp.]